MLIDVTGRLFAQHLDDAAMRRARAGDWLAAAWDAVVAMGLPMAWVPEDAGGFGVPVDETLALIRLSGAHVLPLPLAETMLANHVLASAGLALADGVASVVPASDTLVLANGRLTGTATRVPWGREACVLVVEVAGQVVRIDSGWDVVERATNLAAMPRDTLRIDAAVGDVAPLVGHSLLAQLAAIRAVQIAGALEGVLALTIDHVSTRAQFGRTLSAFQAVQHEVAKLAGEVAAAGAAADIAGEALAQLSVNKVRHPELVSGSIVPQEQPAVIQEARWMLKQVQHDGNGIFPNVASDLPIAAARVRGGEAVGAACGIAQQLHGAIGFTQEHRLHWFTTALWSWRDEAGGQRYWADRVGRAALAAGPDGYWPMVTAA